MDIIDYIMFIFIDAGHSVLVSYKNMFERSEINNTNNRKIDQKRSF